jgi:hypothetical protein
MIKSHIERVVTSGKFELDGGTLPENTTVYTGHGDTTRIGDEIIHYDKWVARGH